MAGEELAKARHRNEERGLAASAVTAAAASARIRH
jgi:hypothetical protein